MVSVGAGAACHGAGVDACGGGAADGNTAGSSVAAELAGKAARHHLLALIVMT